MRRAAQACSLRYAGDITFFVVPTNASIYKLHNTNTITNNQFTGDSGAVSNSCQQQQQQTIVPPSWLLAASSASMFDHHRAIWLAAIAAQHGKRECLCVCELCCAKCIYESVMLYYNHMCVCILLSNYVHLVQHKSRTLTTFICTNVPSFHKNTHYKAFISQHICVCV
jgi:hypothetical protein